jgi:hypothetical protein
MRIEQMCNVIEAELARRKVTGRVIGGEVAASFVVDVSRVPAGLSHLAGDLAHRFQSATLRNSCGWRAPAQNRDRVKERDMIKRAFSIQGLMWLALVLALVGSLRHVAWGFASLENGDIVAGYVQAVAIDIGLLALALGIQQRKRQRRSTLVLWAGVAVFSGVSSYANLLHGLTHQTPLGLSGYKWLVALRPVLLSGVLPLLVLYLAEVTGNDVNYDVKQAERQAKKEARKSARTTVLASSGDSLEHARASRKAQAEHATSALLAFYGANPDATQAQAGASVGRSRQWVSSQLAELEREGVISRNGHGIEVAE